MLESMLLPPEEHQGDSDPLPASPAHPDLSRPFVGEWASSGGSIAPPVA